MKAYSLDLRQRIVQAVIEQHRSAGEVAERFAVGLATVKRSVQLARIADLAPKPIPGRPRTIGPDQHPTLWAQLTAQDDATLAEHCRLWQGTQGVAVSEATMSRAIRRLGWTRKKRHWQPPSGAHQPAGNGATPSPTLTRAASSSSTNQAPMSA